MELMKDFTKRSRPLPLSQLHPQSHYNSSALIFSERNTTPIVRTEVSKAGGHLGNSMKSLPEAFRRSFLLSSIPKKQSRVASPRRALSGGATKESSFLRTWPETTWA